MAAVESECDPEVPDRGLRDAQDVVRKHHEVDQHPLGDGALLVLVKGEVGGFPGMEANRLLDAHRFFQPVHLAVRTLADDRDSDRGQRPVGAESAPCETRTPAISRVWFGWMRV